MKVFRVNVQGLSPTERTVFGGMIQLAERDGIKFQIETALNSSDVLVLDAADRGAVELVQANAEIAQRTIWIDPPEHLHAAHHVKRPLHWPHLLLMLERLADATPKQPFAAKMQPAAAQSQPTAGLTTSQMCMLGENILRTHIGIAAEFIIDDVREDMREVHASASEGDIRDIFLSRLQQRLPTNADAKKIIQQVSAAIAQGGIK